MLYYYYNKLLVIERKRAQMHNSSVTISSVKTNSCFLYALHHRINYYVYINYCIKLYVYINYYILHRSLCMRKTIFLKFNMSYKSMLPIQVLN